MDSKELRELRKLIEFISASDLTEFEMEKEGLRLRLSRAASAAAVPAVRPAAPSVHEAAAAPAARPEPDTASGPAGLAEGLEEIRSPIVGTFYRAPNPDSPAFVDVGDRIKPGQVLCIVEAMKVMNEIEAEISGEIVAVLPTNGQPIEYDEVLFHVRPG